MPDNPEMVAQKPRWWAVFAWQGVFVAEDSAKDEVVGILREKRVQHPRDPEPVAAPVDFMRGGGLFQLMVERTFEEFDFEGLRLRVPSEDLLSFGEAVKLMEPKTDGGSPLYLVGGRGVGLVMRPETKVRFLAAAQAALTPGVAERARANQERVDEAERALTQKIRDGIGGAIGAAAAGEPAGGKLLN